MYSSAYRNFYEILEVPSNAGQDEIKKAFFSRVKETGGPERNPEEYRKLREAYDVLYNKVSRTEYDSMNEFGDEINLLVDEANDLVSISHPDYEKAIKLYKHAVVLGPQIARLRSLLGIAYLENKNYEPAYEQLKKTIDIDDTNPLYWYYFGKVNTKLNRIPEAENCYKRAIEIDPNDNSNNIALAYLYFYNNRKNEAFDLLNRAITSDSVTDFTDFSYFYHKINFLFLDNKAIETKSIFEEIMHIAIKPEEKDYAAWMFIDFAHHLHVYKRFDLMKYLTEAAVTLDPQNKSYQEFNDFVQNNNNVLIEAMWVRAAERGA
jgi:tetratricopeptide (TPR) repeat protein